MSNENKKTEFKIVVKNRIDHKAMLTFHEIESGAFDYGCKKSIYIDYEDLETKEFTHYYRGFDMRYTYHEFNFDLEYFAYWFVATRWYGCKVVNGEYKEEEVDE